MAMDFYYTGGYGIIRFGFNELVQAPWREILYLLSRFLSWVVFLEVIGRFVSLTNYLFSFLLSGKKAVSNSLPTVPAASHILCSQAQYKSKH